MVKNAASFLGQAALDLINTKGLQSLQKTYSCATPGTSNQTRNNFEVGLGTQFWYGKHNGKLQKLFANQYLERQPQNSQSYSYDR